MPMQEITTPNINDRRTTVLVHPTACTPKASRLTTSDNARSNDAIDTPNPKLIVSLSGFSELPRIVWSPREYSFRIEYALAPCGREACSTISSLLLKPTHLTRIENVLVLSPKDRTASMTFLL
jgi:hypothetical protein